MADAIPTRPLRCGPMMSAAAAMMALTLAGCVAVPAANAPAAPPAPARPALEPVGPVPSPYGTAIARVPDAPRPTPVAVTPPPAPPPAPVISGPLDPRTGMHQSAVVAVSGDAASRFTVLFRPGGTDAAKVSAAPAKLCGGAGKSVGSSRTNSPGSGSAMPGVQIMIVTCA